MIEPEIAQMEIKNLTIAMFRPISEPAVLLPIILFWLLLSFGIWGLPFGLFLLFLTLPGVFRFFMILLESSASGTQARAFDAEYFNWSSNAWSLFPLPVLGLLAWATLLARTKYGVDGSFIVLFLTSVFLPPFLIVLAVTHSTMQSLNPLAIARVMLKCASTIWFASLYLLIASWLAIQSLSLPLMWAVLAPLLLLYSFACVVGALVRPYGLVEDVYIPDALEPDENEVAGDIEKVRDQAATHAYGFVSRGNRDGGFTHIVECIDKDPDPVAAWRWYFERMLRWDQPEAALFFAQLYVEDMLRHGEKVPALKLILRCRLIDEQWKPKSEDLPAAIEAAESSGNIELATVLKRY